MFDSVNRERLGNRDGRPHLAFALALLMLVLVTTVWLGTRLNPPAQAGAFATPVASWSHCWVIFERMPPRKQ